MKGLIFVILIVFGLCFFALETRGQPVPDQEEVEVVGTFTHVPGSNSLKAWLLHSPAAHCNTSSLNLISQHHQTIVRKLTQCLKISEQATQPYKTH